MKRSGIKKSRSKPRAGRVKGKAMKALREESYEQRNGMCIFCGTKVVFEQMELAHIKAKRIYGDSLENVGPSHAMCHYDSHNPKACPPKVRTDAEV